jgi:hypothetical protein
MVTEKIKQTTTELQQEEEKRRNEKVWMYLIGLYRES